MRHDQPGKRRAALTAPDFYIRDELRPLKKNDRKGIAKARKACSRHPFGYSVVFTSGDRIVGIGAGMENVSDAITTAITRLRNAYSRGHRPKGGVIATVTFRPNIIQMQKFAAQGADALLLISGIGTDPDGSSRKNLTDTWLGTYSSAPPERALIIRNT